MTGGRITETGSYEQLLSHDGAFARLLQTYVTTESSDDDSDQEGENTRKQGRDLLENTCSQYNCFIKYM